MPVLSTTLLTQACGASDSVILPASLTGVVPGVFLYIERELLRVIDATLPGGFVKVQRGQAGTATGAHASQAVVTLGTGDQFSETDPTGMPPVGVLQPWINLRNGSIWVPQGDEMGTGVNARYWREVSSLYSTGPLGVRQSRVNPTFAGVDT